MPTPAVLQSPNANASLKSGLDMLANLLALTLGPAGGAILVEGTATSKPELVSDAATIARRMLDFPHRAQNVGAMLLRNLVWQTHLQVGDGTATAAVLAQAILDGAHRYRAAGASVMILRKGIERAALVVEESLRQMARPVADEDELVQVAQTITGEPELSLILGEMFDILGPDAYIAVENYVAPHLDREYQEGGRWDGRLASPYFINDPGARRAVQETTYVALFDGTITELDDVKSLLELMAQLEPHRLIIAARVIRGAALTALAANHQQKNFEILAVELREPGQSGTDDFVDLAALTGARVLSEAAGFPLATISTSDLGYARRAEANTESLVVVGQLDQPGTVRERVETLRARREKLAENDDDAKEDLRQRLARLSGCAGTLRIGAATKVQLEVLRQKANKGLRAMPIALREGVVPGGGVALLNCIPALHQLDAVDEEAWGIAIVAGALEEPFKRIVRNASQHSPSMALAEAQQRGNEYGYDALSRQSVHMREAGILDAVGVLSRAFSTAVSGATMALTTDTIVLKRHPDMSDRP